MKIKDFRRFLNEFDEESEIKILVNNDACCEIFDIENTFHSNVIKHIEGIEGFTDDQYDGQSFLGTGNPGDKIKDIIEKQDIVFIEVYTNF